MLRREEEQGEDTKGHDDNEEIIDDADIVEEDDLEDKDQIGAAIVDEEKQIIHSAVN